MNDKERDAAHRVRRGNVVASIWANKSKDGKPFFSTTVEAFYLRDGETRYSSRFSSGQLAQLERVARLADAWIEEREEAAFWERKASEENEVGLEDVRDEFDV